MDRMACVRWAEFPARAGTEHCAGKHTIRVSTRHGG
jgi:hypothetical protein